MQIFLRPPGDGLRPYGQPGQLPSGNRRLPLLIELKAQFYKLVTLQPVRGYVHQLVKRSIRVVKVVFAVQTLYRKQEAEGEGFSECGKGIPHPHLRPRTAGIRILTMVTGNVY